MRNGRMLKVEPVERRVFRAEHVTEGKIAVDEDRSTPIFSPYAGRVTKLLAQPGRRGEARPAAVHHRSHRHGAGAERFHCRGHRAQQGALAALACRDHRKAHEQPLSRTRRSRCKEVEQAQAALVAAQNDMRSAETALEAVRNRLRILGKTDDEITDLPEDRQDQRRDPDLRADRRERSCSARSGPGSMSATARPIRCS